MLTHEQLMEAIPGALQAVDLAGWGAKQSGKVRDIYARAGRRVLIATDRVSAFDRVLGAIPYKGQVLNQLSAWWFDQVRDLAANHVVAVPDPNAMVVRDAQPLPVEVVVRGYITGVTQTSLWRLYEQGQRSPYGVALPDGLRKNDPLPAPIITPTTKAAGGAHDEPLTRDDIARRRLVDPQVWEQTEAAALAVFARGQAIARRAGLILVDTKYEFGLVDGNLALIDEIHTPDSSRFWTAESCRPGAEPENFDKEYLRLWFAGRGYRGDGEPPTMPADFVARVAARYIAAYERLTSRPFVAGEQPAAGRIQRNLDRWRLQDEGWKGD